MSIKSTAAKFLAKRDVRRIRSWADRPIEAQKATCVELFQKLRRTAYGKSLNLPAEVNEELWATLVPLVSYEEIRPYIDRIRAGESDVLYPGRPAYFCTTSGTTSGSKYIPMTKEGIKAQIKAARNALMAYIHETGNADFVDGKMIFLQGSPVTESQNGIEIGRLSGIVAHHVPNYLQKNRMPNWDTNCIDDWDKKVDAIAAETLNEDMRLISGIPPWVQMYFEKLMKKSGKSDIKSIFPNLSVFAHGGVNFDPYRTLFKTMIGEDIDSIETYPASEGFIAFQDSQKEDGLLLNLDAGIFFEFIPIEDIHNENPARLPLSKVELDKNYAVVLNTSSGLWGYVIGDTIKFTCLRPYRLVVTGRIAHFISAFGEHVIAEEVESAITEVSKKMGMMISEFHVAPLHNPDSGLPRHQWFVESDSKLPDEFAHLLDKALCARNKYYDDLIVGNVLQRLDIVPVSKGVFNQYMESIGKLGGQNKLPRLANDRKVADGILAYL